MKNILVSTTAEKGFTDLIRFGAYLAVRLHARLLLYTAIQETKPKTKENAKLTGEVIDKSVSAQIKKFEKSVAKGLRELKSPSSREIDIKTETDAGPLIESLANRTEKGDILLVVMTKNRNSMIHKITGESGENLLNLVKCPVCFIPTDTKFTPVKTVGYLVNHQKEHIDHINSFVNLVQGLGNKLIFFHPKGKDEYKHQLLKEGYIEKLSKVDNLHNINHISIDEENKKTGISDVVKKEKVDMMIFMNEKKNLIKQIFTENLSEQILEEFMIPVVVFPDY
ncbi:MAG: hypothetical protein KDC05_06935 [Bacteroidales bacterium]|nr:hypothetical protein [Bacteroidales bacterium]